MADIHTIDASGKSLGRVASEAAKLLMGKMNVAFQRNKKDTIKVHVENAGMLKISAKKLITETHKRYSGYPGGLTEEKIGHVAERKGKRELVKHAVSGMIPRNKLHTELMKNLTISE